MYSMSSHRTHTLVVMKKQSCIDLVGKYSYQHIAEQIVLLCYVEIVHRNRTCTAVALISRNGFLSAPAYLKMAQSMCVPLYVALRRGERRTKEEWKEKASGKIVEAR